MKITTIPQLCEKFNLADFSVRWIFTKNEIKPISNVDTYVGRVKQHRKYHLAECEKAINDHLNAKNKPIKQSKNYSNEFVCKVLRNNVKSYLNHKLISLWSFYDWQEFNKMIPQ